MCRVIALAGCVSYNRAACLSVFITTISVNGTMAKRSMAKFVMAVLREKNAPGPHAHRKRERQLIKNCLPSNRSTDAQQKLRLGDRNSNDVCMYIVSA